MKLFSTLFVLLPALALAAPVAAPDDGNDNGDNSGNSSPPPDLGLGPAVFSGQGTTIDGAPFNGAMFQVPQDFNNFASFNQLPLLLDGQNGSPRAINVNGKKLYFGIGQALNIDQSRLNQGSLCTRVNGVQVPHFKAKYPTQFGARKSWWRPRGRDGQLEEREAAPEPEAEAQPEANLPEEKRFFFGLLIGIITGITNVVVGLVAATLGLTLALVKLSFGIIAGVISACFGLIGGVTGIIFGPVGCNIFPQEPYWPDGHCLWLPGGRNVTYGGCYTPPDGSYQVWVETGYDDSYQVWEENGSYYPVVTYDEQGTVQRWAPQ